MVQNRYEFVEGFLAAMTLANNSLFPQENNPILPREDEKQSLSRIKKLLADNEVSFEKLLDVPTFIRRGKRIRIDEA